MSMKIGGSQFTSMASPLLWRGHFQELGETKQDWWESRPSTSALVRSQWRREVV
jgi:hypothetical protein